MDKRKRSAKQERGVAKDLGGRVVPGSGSQWHSKNDVTAPRFSVECKYTDGKSYSLKAADVSKAKKQALFEGREFAFQINLPGHRLAVVDYEVLVELEDLYREGR